uniref:Family with sequence similarity 210 member B n=1 Tax=Neogobius melanostomus TaxID=47308 RepID=A0A8C6T2F0_9GOBI
MFKPSLFSCKRVLTFNTAAVSCVKLFSCWISAPCPLWPCCKCSYSCVKALLYRVELLSLCRLHCASGFIPLPVFLPKVTNTGLCALMRGKGFWEIGAGSGGGKPNKTQQLKKVFQEYGAVGMSFHICMSLMSLGMFYLLVSSGIDMAALLCKLGFSETMVRSKMAAGTSTFVLAYAIHKLFAPVRISITLVSVPLIVRHFRRIGRFKPPPPTP